MSPPYAQGQSLAWLTPEPDGVRVHRAVVQTIEPGDDTAHWRVVTDRGAATVDARGAAGHIVPIDTEIERELYIHGGDSYLVPPTYIDLAHDLARDLDLGPEHVLDHETSLDLDDGYGLD